MPPPPPPPPARPAASGDLDPKDPQLIFQAVWDDLKEQHGAENLKFPREFIWLGGAPGAGKGTNTPFIARLRGIDADPVVISSLLTSPRAVALKNAGKMVGDREVIGLLFDELLKPVYHDGVVVDGFPRTQVQVECLKLFYHRLLGLHDEHRSTPQARDFRKPMFRIALLYVSEDVSVARQIKRGEEIRRLNQLVREAGVGKLLEERVTDLDVQLCRGRYRTFSESTFAALQSLRQIFHFHFIDAEGDLAEVQRNIEKEFSYQSSLELSHEVFDLIRAIPVASQLAAHARQELVERLDSYEEEHRPLFEKVVRLISDKLIPVVKAHAFTGHARFNTEDELLDDPLALRMMIDVMSERGFHTSVDIHKMDVPVRVNPETWEICCRTKKVYRIEVRYQPSNIRRGH
ncbi:MAG: nucleoside monophosphate kinase [Gemmataceae bacterium]